MKETLESGIGPPPLDKTIVLLGSFEGKNYEFLEEIKTILNDKPYSYHVAVVDELKILPGISTPRKKLHFVLSAARFIIADDTSPSGEILELEYSRHCGAVVAIISRKRNSSWMTLDCTLHSNDFERFNFDSSVDNLEELLEKIVRWSDGRRNYIDQEMRTMTDRRNEQMRDVA